MPNYNIPEQRPNPKRVGVILTGFGLQALNVKVFPPSKQMQGKHTDFPVTGIEPGDQAIGKSMLGTMVFSSLTLYPKDSENDPNKKITIDTVLIDVSMEKNIVKTSVQGRNGTVKEFISDGDFQLSIRGSLADKHPERYPKDQVEKMKAICDIQEQLVVECPFLLLFNIKSLVIDSYSFPQQEGFYNVQLFQLDCSSDTPIELQQ